MRSERDYDLSVNNVNTKFLCMKIKQIHLNDWFVKFVVFMWFWWLQKPLTIQTMYHVIHVDYMKKKPSDTILHRPYSC